MVRGGGRVLAVPGMLAHELGCDVSACVRITEDCGRKLDGASAAVVVGLVEEPDGEGDSMSRQDNCELPPGGVRNIRPPSCPRSSPGTDNGFALSESPI